MGGPSSSARSRDPGPFEGSSQGGRFRLFLLDIPGDSAGVLTIAVMSTPDAFEDAIAEIAPILDSVQVHPG